MKTWIQRVAGILLLSFGIVSLVFPFRDYRVESVSRETIRARTLGYVDGYETGSALSKAWNLDESKSQPLPAELENALNSIAEKGAEETSVSFLAGMDLLMDCLPPEGVPVETGGIYLVRKGKLVYEIRNPSAVFWKMIVESAGAVQNEGEGRISVSLAGKVFPENSGWVIDPVKWKEYPRIASVFSSSYRSIESSPLPTREEWNAFVSSSGGQIDDEGWTRVILKGRLYLVEPTTRHVDEKPVVPHLRVTLRAIGGGALLVGLLLLISLYRSRQIPDAIQIGTPGMQVAGDTITAILASFAMIPLLDAFLCWLFNTDPIADEEFIFFMSVFFLLVGVPAVALYLSLIGSQWFQASSSGVRLRSLFSNRFLEWGQLEEVEVDRGTPLPTTRSGLILPRTLQKSLVFRGQGERIGVMEPSESRKREIVAESLQHAPEPWQERIQEAGADWLGYEAW